MLGLLIFEGGYILLYCGTPSFWQRGLWDSCFQNPSESSETLSFLMEDPSEMVQIINEPLSDLSMFQQSLTLQQTTNFVTFSPIFNKNKVGYYMRIVYHVLLFIFEKAAKFEIVVCCKL